MDSLQINFLICAGVCLLTWVLSLLTHEHSWVDRIWSIIPVVYMWVFAAAAQFNDARLNVIAVLVTLWGVRLTFNFARKGGYRPGGEDYRWEILRQRMPKWQYELFNIFFIVIYQNILLLLITMPAWVILQSPANFSFADALLALLFLGLLTMETVADQQQWNFHQAKKEALSHGKKVSPPFLTTGLFAFSRHPNFFSEQAQWWVIYLFSAFAVGNIFNWSIVGAFLLTLLFIGSTRFTEAISLAKYPEYALYKKRVSMLVPWLPNKKIQL